MLVIALTPADGTAAAPISLAGIVVRLVFGAMLCTAGMAWPRISAERTTAAANTIATVTFACYVALVLATGGTQGANFSWTLVLPLAVVLIVPVSGNVLFLLCLAFGLSCIGLLAITAEGSERLVTATADYVASSAVAIIAQRQLRALRDAERRAFDRTRTTIAAAAESERLALIGRLSAGVAHEINNPLAYVQSNVCCLLEELAARSLDDEELRVVGADTLQGLARIGMIVNDLKGLAREPSRDLASCTFEPLVDESIRLAAVRVRRTARILKSVPKDLPSAHVDPGSARCRLRSAGFSRGCSDLLVARSQGIAFPEGIDRQTVLSGFRVISTSDAGASTITITGSAPTLKDLDVGAAARLVDRSVAVEVLAGASIRANPRIEQCVLNAGTARRFALGLDVTRSSAELWSSTSLGGTVMDGGSAVGGRLRDTEGVVMLNSFAAGCWNMVAAPPSGRCVGLMASGSDDVVVGASTLHGCNGMCPAAGELLGVELGECRERFSERGSVLTQSTIIGAQSDAKGSVASAVYVSGGCRVAIENNALLRGASTAQMGGNVMGVACVDPPEDAGRATACSLSGNNILSTQAASAVPSQAGGVLCSGRCPGDAGACTGGCVAIIENEIDAMTVASGGAMVHANLFRSSPYVVRNRIGLRQNASGVNTRAYGLLLSDSNAQITSNFIRGGAAPTSVGITQATSRSSQRPKVDSNSVYAGEASSGVGYGLELTDLAAPPSGRYTNNILYSGPLATTASSHGVLLRGTSLPLELRNNMLQGTYYYAAGGYFVSVVDSAAPGLHNAASFQAAHPSLASGNFDVIAGGSPALPRQEICICRPCRPRRGKVCWTAE